MGLLILVIIVAIAFWQWRVSLRRWPYTRCRACGGHQRKPGSNQNRWGKCPQCGGTGRQLRRGAHE